MAHVCRHSRWIRTFEHLLLLWMTLWFSGLWTVHGFGYIELFGNNIIDRRENRFQRRTYIDLSSALPSGAVTKCHAFTANVISGQSDVIHFGIWQKVTALQFRLRYDHPFQLVSGQQNISFVPAYFYIPEGSYMGLTFEQFPGGILFDYKGFKQGRQYGLTSIHSLSAFPSVNSLVSLIFSSFYIDPSFSVEIDLRIPAITGVTGHTGVVGATGPQGVQGVVGVTGVTGPRGPVPTDFDECSMNTASCTAHSMCRNTFTGYICECDTGYTRQNDSCEGDIMTGATCGAGDAHSSGTSDLTFGFCEDVDECLDKNGGCMHNCTNTMGGVNCSCWPGFGIADNDRSCTDIDECLNNSLCYVGICFNSPGSYRCLGISLGAVAQPFRSHWNFDMDNTIPDKRNITKSTAEAVLVAWMTLVSLAVLLLVLFNVRQFVKNRRLRRMNRMLRRRAEVHHMPEIVQHNSSPADVQPYGSGSCGAGSSH